MAHCAHVTATSNDGFGFWRLSKPECLKTLSKKWANQVQKVISMPWMSCTVGHAVLYRLHILMGTKACPIRSQNVLQNKTRSKRRQELMWSILRRKKCFTTGKRSSGCQHKWAAFSVAVLHLSSTWRSLARQCYSLASFIRSKLKMTFFTGNISFFGISNLQNYFVFHIQISAPYVKVKQNIHID